MKKLITLYNPTAAKKETNQTATQSAYQYKIETVGFIDNSKPNFQFLADDLSELLLNRLGVKKILRERKNAASLPAPPEMLQKMIDECDLVIAGSGD